MKFEVEGTKYNLDLSTFTTGDAIMMKSNTKLTLGDLIKGISEMDGVGIAGLVYLAKRRNKEAVRWADLNDLNLISVIETFDTSDEEVLEDKDKKQISDQDAVLKDGENPKSATLGTSSSSDTTPVIPRSW